MTDTPILFVIFNRPSTALKVMDSIRLAKPNRLYIAADGPRKNNESDIFQCRITRAKVVENIDWPCEVKTLFRDNNIGCRKGVTEAINWFFNHEEMGIILEDDCIPDPSFFKFCDQLLNRYKDDLRIGMISGNNFGFKLYDSNLSYSFSKHGLIWGWATWRRAWKFYNESDFYISDQVKKLIKRNISSNQLYTHLWWEEAEHAMSDQESVWDYLWGIARYSNNLLIVRPCVNLVANIGFGDDATHTSKPANKIFSISESLGFPLKHPAFIMPDTVADSELENFRIKAYQQQAKKISKSLFKRMKTRLHYIYLSLFNGKS